MSWIRLFVSQNDFLVKGGCLHATILYIILSPLSLARPYKIPGLHISIN